MKKTTKQFLSIAFLLLAWSGLMGVIIYKAYRAIHGSLVDLRPDYGVIDEHP